MISDLKRLIKTIDANPCLSDTVKTWELAQVQHGDKCYPLYAFRVGNPNPESPTLFITGGVHGLERVGAQLAWSLLKTTIDRLIWDKALNNLFQDIRLIVVPLLNPVGYRNYTRSNGNGVDLMRNAPIEAVDPTPFLLGGHRFSKKLPWYQGNKGEVEDENKALFQLFKNEITTSSTLISMDFHSGFGLKDRIWFPYSYTKEPFEHLAQMNAFTHLFEQTHPYHVYQIEPQSMGYLLSGDLWDYLYLEFLKENKQGTYLPLTLEMGSWSWVRKNPMQLFSKHGAFNPIREHRLKRTFRRHHLLFDFLLKALNSSGAWSNSDPVWIKNQQESGLSRWY